MNEANRIDLFLYFNSIFEGSIGIFHIFFPWLIYGYGSNDTLENGRYPYDKVIFSKFVGSMMLSISFMSYVIAKSKDYHSVGAKAIIAGLAFYHGMASILNFTIGCGIDGDFGNYKRDYLHCIIHGFISIGLMYSSWVLYGQRQKDT